MVGDTTSPWRWIIDPIDGTSNFVRRIPVWATLVALTHTEHGPVVGVVSAPALGRRWWASRGAGAFADGRPCRVSSVADIADAQVFGVSDEVYGEEVCCWVILRQGAALQPEDVIAHCKGRIAHYKVPRHVRIVDSFIMTVTGKAQKIEMRKVMEAELSAAA